MEQKEKQRTLTQNKALHLYMQKLADELNDSGHDMRKTLRAGVEIPWSGDTVKEYLFKPIMKAQLDIDSTTQMTTKDIDSVFNTLNRHLGEKLGVHVAFPSIQGLIIERGGDVQVTGRQ